MPQDPHRHATAYHGPYAVLDEEECKAVLGLMTELELMIGTSLRSAYDKLAKTQEPIYGNMRKPL